MPSGRSRPSTFGAGGFYITSCDLRWSLCATKYWCCVQPMLRPFYRKDLAQSCPILYLGLLILAGLAGIFPTWPGATSVGRKADAWNLTRFFEKKTHFFPFLVARTLPSELIGWLGWWFGRALSSEQNVLSFCWFAFGNRASAIVVRKCRPRCDHPNESKWYSSRFSVQKHKLKWLYKEETQASHQNSRINI